MSYAFKSLSVDDWSPVRWPAAYMWMSINIYIIPYVGPWISIKIYIIPYNGPWISIEIYIIPLNPLTPKVSLTGEKMEKNVYRFREASI